MRIIEINGNKFSTLKEFYLEIERKMTNGLNWQIGQNLDALNDVLRGGFGVQEIDEKFILIWYNSKKSKSDLSNFDQIVEIIKEHDNIELQFK